MLGDPVVKNLFKTNDYKISLNTKFQLRIEHIPGPEVAAVDETADTDNSQNSEA
jgi:hypothetical protein